LFKIYDKNGRLVSKNIKNLANDFFSVVDKKVLFKKGIQKVSKLGYGKKKRIKRDELGRFYVRYYFKMRKMVLRDEEDVFKISKVARKHFSSVKNKYSTFRIMRLWIILTPQEEPRQEAMRKIKVKRKKTIYERRLYYKKLLTQGLGTSFGYRDEPRTQFEDLEEKMFNLLSKVYDYTDFLEYESYKVLDFGIEFREYEGREWEKID